MKQHVISVLVENRFGVLARVAQMFSLRGYNIDSLCVGTTLDPTVSRMTIVTTGDDRVLEQIRKQLLKLVEVIDVKDFTGEDHVDRELALLKVDATDQTRPSIIQYAEIFRTKIVDVSPRSVTIEVTGAAGKVSAFVDLMRPFGIREIARTGRIALSRGEIDLKPEA